MSDATTPPAAPAAPAATAPVAPQASAPATPPAPPQPAAPANANGSPTFNINLPSLPESLQRILASAPPPSPIAAPAEAPKPAETPRVEATPAMPPAPPAPPQAPVADDPVTAMRAQMDAMQATLKAQTEAHAALQASYRAEKIRATVERVAVEAGALNVADVIALNRDHLDVTDDGQVIAKSDPKTTGAQVVARFLADRPHMMRPTVPSGGAGTPAAPVAPAAPPPRDLKSVAGATAVAISTAQRLGYLPTAKPS